MQLISNFRYRPEVDGLRALAVVAVVLYHAGIGLPGGFIGVDVFFVISGYLITSLILKDLQNDTFTLAGFWERRARRIIPAVVVVVLATLAAGWFLLFPSDYALLGKSAAWQALFAANFYFWRHTSYFDGPAEQQPLLHTWSLAVEEQFYLFFPIILFLIFRFPKLRRRAALLVLFGFGFSGSLALSAWAVTHTSSAAFYLLPARAWELLCGAIVAILPPASFPKSRILRESATWLGLAAIVAPCILYTKTTPFPGIAALPPCLGTALFVWASGKENDGENPRPLPSAARFLSLSPVVFVGLVSYSFYLWHWPMFAFSRYITIIPLSLGDRITIIGVAFLLSVVSWRFVETPFRKRKLCARRPAMFRTAAAGIAAVFAAGVALAGLQGIPKRLSPKSLAFAKAREDMEFIHDLSLEDARSGRLPLLGVPDPNAPISLLVWGDSHAMAAMPAIDRFLKDRGLTGRQATHSATAPILGAEWSNPPYGLGKDAKDWNQAVFQYVLAKNIPAVFLGCFWPAYATSNPTTRAKFKADFLSTVETLHARGVQVYVMIDPPTQNVDVPMVLVLGETFHFDPAPFQKKKSEWDGKWGDCPASPAEIRNAGGRIVNPLPAMLDPGGTYYEFLRNGTPLYRDNQHLTPEGAIQILLPILHSKISLPGPPARPKQSTE